MIFRARNFAFRFPRSAVLMGIVNVTPDSFSDGGQFFDRTRAIEHGLRLVAEGAEILDIGGESTRPGAEPVPESEELSRVLPVIEGLRARTDKAISIDTQKPGVAERALQAGADMVNDIAGNRGDARMWEVVAATGAGYVLMHMKGTPQTMQRSARYEDVVEEVSEFFSEKLQALESAGVNREQVVLDPGIGFAKTAEHNFKLLARLNRFRIYRRPMLVGASRKSFIGKLLGSAVDERLPGSLACAVWSVLNGVQILRVHDVAATVQAVRVIEEIQARLPSE